MAKFEKNMQRQRAMDAIYLSTCALHGITPEWIPEGDLTELYELCQLHGISAIVAMALEGYWKVNPSEDAGQKSQWQQAKDQAIRKNILLNAEREGILRQLDEIGCWYLPLKGSLLQFDYPKFGMRQMTDNDILFDPEKQSEIHDLMLRRGFEAIKYKKSNEDVYQKPPVYTFEMHTALFQKEAAPELADYYADIKGRLVKDEGNPWGYHMTHEDFYIYLIAHSYKHYVYSGTGLRNLMDEYVFLRKYGSELDENYIHRELQKLGAAEFETQCRNLVHKLFDSPRRVPELTAQEQTMLDRFIFAGAYGSKEIRIQDQLSRGKGKMAYVLSRLFPSVKALSVDYPDLPNRKWKLPFIWIWRLIRAVFVHPGQTAAEWKQLRKSDK